MSINIEKLFNEKKPTRKGWGEGLTKLGRKHENVIVLDADLSKSTYSAYFKKEFPERFINVGIAEQNLVNVAGGLSIVGKIPFAHSFAMFITGRAYDQVRNTISYSKLNVKLAGSHSGLTVGEDGATHQALEDIALMNGLPNMNIIVPADAVQAEQAPFLAYNIEGPVYIRLGRAAVPVIFDENYKMEFGKGDILREGEDICVISCGLMTAQAVIAHEILKEKGISMRIVNLSTIKPLDEKLVLESAKKCKRIITAEEHSINGGLGSIISGFLSEEYPVPVRRIGVKDVFGESGKPDELLEKYGLTYKSITAAALEILEK